MYEDENPDQDQYEQWHSDPGNWKAGLFYFNKKDKRIFLPKRLKWMGYTINFANPVSLIVLLVMTGLLLIQAVYLQ
jgi:uncharacterized membrane protein